MLIGTWIIIGAFMELEMGGYVSLAAYMLVGIGLGLIMDIRRKRNPGKHELITLTPADKERFGSIE
jgi:hypothetical protein